MDSGPSSMKEAKLGRLVADPIRILNPNSFKKNHFDNWIKISSSCLGFWTFSDLCVRDVF